MNIQIKERILNEAEYIINTKKTIRELATIFKVSKSTVHKDLHYRLMYIDRALYNKVYNIFQYHINIRHIRGGQSTKKKYENLP